MQFNFKYKKKIYKHFISIRFLMLQNHYNCYLIELNYEIKLKIKLKI